MEKSNFQFSNPQLDSLEFKLNDNFETKDNQKIVIKPVFETKIQRVKDDNIAKVYLSIDINENVLFSLNATIFAFFKWDDNVYNDEQIDNLLKYNASSLLIAYLRPIVSNITNMAGIPTYNIPFIDFTK